MKLGQNPLRTLLCIGAHSDDIEIGCGGTVLELLEACPEAEVHWVVLSGDEKRAAEARASAEAFLQNAASKNVITKTFRDSYFPYIGSSIKDYFHQLAATVNPDLILTHCGNDAHQDHRVVSELTWNAFRGHLILEYEIPKYDGDLGRPNMFVPLSKDSLDKKVSSLLSCFVSQESKPWFSEDAFRALPRLRGLESHATSGLAEAFYCRKATLAL